MTNTVDTVDTADTADTTDTTAPFTLSRPPSCPMCGRQNCYMTAGGTILVCRRCGYRGPVNPVNPVNPVVQGHQ